MTKYINFFMVLFCSLLFSGCKDNTEDKKNEKEIDRAGVNEKKSAEISDFKPPDFNDPALKQYYAEYTQYLKSVATTIRNRDEAGTMKLFREEGKQWDNRNEMEDKARSSPEEEQKFTTWLIQSLPYNKEIVQSEYYKKYSIEYEKKVKEDFKKKGY